MTDDFERSQIRAADSQTVRAPYGAAAWVRADGDNAGYWADDEAQYAAVEAWRVQPVTSSEEGPEETIVQGVRGYATTADVMRLEGEFRALQMQMAEVMRRLSASGAVLIGNGDVAREDRDLEQPE